MARKQHWRLDVVADGFGQAVEDMHNILAQASEDGPFTLELVDEWEDGDEDGDGGYDHYTDADARCDAFGERD